MLTTLILSGTLLLSPLAYVHGLPGGHHVQRIDIVDALPRGAGGFVSLRRPQVLNLLSTLPRTHLKEFLVHESSHSIFFQCQGRPDTRYPFGRAPFISKYAQVSAIEDAAETYAAMVLRPETLKGMEKKVEAIRKCL